MAGSRTRINCLEGSYADRYTTNALIILAKKKQIFNAKFVTTNRKDTYIKVYRKNVLSKSNPPRRGIEPRSPA